MLLLSSTRESRPGRRAWQSHAHAERPLLGVWGPQPPLRGSAEGAKPPRISEGAAGATVPCKSPLEFAEKRCYNKEVYTLPRHFAAYRYRRDFFGKSGEENILYHHPHLLPVRQAAHRPHLLHRCHRRHGPLQAHAGVRRHVPDRHRRARPEDRGQGQGSRRHPQGVSWTTSSRARAACSTCGS